MKELIFESIVIRGVNVPLNNPLVAHIGNFDKWPFLCIDVITNHSIVGRSYIGPYLVDQLPSIAHCIKALSKKFVKRAIEPSTFFDEGMKNISLLGYKGIGLYALAALDIAFWDAHSKNANQPLAQHLGGGLKPIKSYNSGGLWLIPLKEISKEAAALRKEADFTALKLRIGRETYKEDIAAFDAVKKGAGEDVLVLSDFNQCYTPKEAERRCKELDDTGFFWFEEPMKYDNYSELSSLKNSISTPITIGENFHGPRDLHKALESKACDMIMPDLMRIGGVTGWLRAAAIAETYNMEFSTHLYPEVSSHLMTVTPNSEWCEYVDWANPIIKEAYKVKDGNIIIPEKVGTGIEWDEENISRYSVNLNL